MARTFGGTLDAVVTDTRGNTLAGINVHAWDAATGGVALGTTVSGVDGSFELTLDTTAPGVYVSAGTTGPRRYVPAREAVPDLVTSLGTKANAATVGALTVRVDTTETRVGTVEDEVAGRLSEPVLSSTFAGARAMRGRALTVTPREDVSDGTLVANFTAGWTVNGGAPAVSQHSGYDANGVKTGPTSRTGQPSMLKMVPSLNTAEQIRLDSANIKTPALGGKFGLWVYLENQPGYQAGGTATGSLSIELSTNASTSIANGVFWAWSIDQLREGWNFLKFVMRNPNAYVTSPGGTEYHPVGVVAGKYGTGADGNIVANPVATIRINTANLLGATLYFDSVWTGWTHKCEVVIGTDLINANMVNHMLPAMQAKGWVGYIAAPLRVWSAGDKIITNPGITLTNMRTMYDAGWDVINHTANHLPMGTLTNPGEVAYEIEAARGYWRAHGFSRGAEFYAAPQGSQSRLSETVLKGLGIVLQRAARKSNVTVTGFGVDKLDQVGSSDISSAGGNVYSKTTNGAGSNVVGLQQFSKIKNVIDAMEAYGDSWFPFIHDLTTLGDTGSGEDLTGDNLTMTVSAFTKTLDYLAAREAAGGLRVRDSFTGWYYGTGR